MNSSPTHKPILLLVGGGFAAQAALRVLCRHRKQYHIQVVLPRGATFLPLLPDLVAGKLDTGSMFSDPGPRLERLGYDVHRQAVLSIDPEQREATLEDGTRLAFTAALLCPGAVQNSNLPQAHILDSLQAATSIRDQARSLLTAGGSPLLCVVGGGYTGVELISALARLARSFPAARPRFLLLQKAARILPGLPEGVVRRCRRQLAAAGIECLTGTELVRKGKQLYLNGKPFSPQLLCQATGMRGAGHSLLPEHAHEQDGRLVVDPFLRVTDAIFAAGDAAHFEHGRDKALRQSVNFAILQGRRAARNLLRSLRGRTLRPFRALDPGWVVPVYVPGRAYGRALGLPVYGRPGLFLHYMMSFYRAFSWKNRRRLLAQLLFPRTRQRQDYT